MAADSDALDAFRSFGLGSPLPSSNVSATLSAKRSAHKGHDDETNQRGFPRPMARGRMRGNDADAEHHRTANPGRGFRAAELAYARPDLLGAAVQPARAGHDGQRQSPRPRLVARHQDA